MKFDAPQIAALSANLSRDHVKTRAQSGRNLSYIEGWVAIKEANRIFGFDGWTRETVEIRLVSERERKIGQAGADGWGVTYVTRVRIMVGEIIREGCGSGHGIDRDLGQAHESAIKESETDAMKRALMTFGNPFGLALYDKEQTEVGDPTPIETKDPDITEGVKNWVEKQKGIINAAVALPALYAWLDDVASMDGMSGDMAKPSSGSALNRLKRKEPKAYAEINQYYQTKIEALSKKLTGSYREIK